MKHAHFVKLTVFCYEHENKAAILEAFLRFFPFSLGENNIPLNKTSAAGFNEKKIEIFEVVVQKNSMVAKFFENLLVNLDAKQKEIILEQIESRLDGNLDFFIRFDKDAWLNEKKLVLTDSGKCFHLKISVAAFPKKREVALNLIRSLLS